VTENLERLPRLGVPAIDEILGKPFAVLDDGFVRVVDYMGADESVVQAARVSYGRGTKKISEDRSLIRYLLRHRHSTPFEMCEIKLHVRVPMDCWRQWIRHRTANVNEYSTRYSIAIDATQRTDPRAWRKQAPGNKQGSEGTLEETIGRELSAKEERLQDACRAVYQERLDAGVSREQARKDLPLSTYTEAYWKIDLHNLLRFLSLRMDVRAQEEIREYARVIGHEIVSRWCPIVWEAFLDYQMNTMTLSRLEIEVVSAIGRGDMNKALELAEGFGWLKADDKGLKANRERTELEEKLAGLDLPVPWRK
jgi:thymidylate synthase (FAD)